LSSALDRSAPGCATIAAMGVRGIDHVQLAMPAGGEERATEFYQGLLGIPRVAKPANLARRGGCWFESHTTRVHLGVDEDFRPARKAHPALLVDGLDELVETLTRSGATLHGGEPLEGYEHLYVDDPFGNRIELLEPAAPASPTMS
jgi:catechol 2,3-dioxygenase-like lactoylglutathione lyase family enzyme